jgi:hypothetical protein
MAEPRSARVFAAALLIAALGVEHAVLAVISWVFGEPPWQVAEGSVPKRALPVRLLAHARSLPSLWRRSEGRHTARGIPLDGLLEAPGPWDVPLPDADVMSPAELTDLDVKPPMARPFTDSCRWPRRAGATTAARRAA